MSGIKIMFRNKPRSRHRNMNARQSENHLDEAHGYY